MDVASTDLYMKVAGNSAADITGTTKYYTLFATSKAKVDSRTLEAMDVRVEAASGAEAYVCATERLQMTSDTGAAIFYRGEPSNCPFLRENDGHDQQHRPIGFLRLTCFTVPACAVS